jgi:hypothetical protein
MPLPLLWKAPISFPGGINSVTPYLGLTGTSPLGEKPVYPAPIQGEVGFNPKL